MRILCTKKNLNQGLILTSRVIGSGGTLPVLNNILLKTDEGRLKLSSTNLEVAINTWVGGKIEEEGELTVPARLVNDYINNLLGDKITLQTESQTLTIQAEKAKTHIKGLSGEEFPLIPKITEEVYARLEGKILKLGLSEVGFAASYSETQPEISGVYFSFEAGELVMAATDRYRLAERKVSLSAAVAAPRAMIIPSRAVSEIIRILPDGPVEVFLTEGQIMFRTPDTELISRLINGQYPDYRQIIPKNFDTEATVDRSAMVQSLKAASLFTTDNNNIELEMNPQTKQIVIKSQSAQTGDSEIRLDATVEGGKNTIIFNYRYLVECLGNLKDDQIIIKMIDAGSPAQIVPAGRNDYQYIVMPIKI